MPAPFVPGVPASRRPDVRIDLINAPTFQAHCHTCGWLSEKWAVRGHAETEGDRHAQGCPKC